MSTKDVNLSARNQQNLKNEVERIIRKYNSISPTVDQKLEVPLNSQIDKWEKEMTSKIKSAADSARKDLKKAIENSNKRLKDSLGKLKKELSSPKVDKITAEDVSKLNQLLGDCQNASKEINEMKVVTKDVSQLDLIQIQKGSQSPKQTDPGPSQTPENPENRRDWSPSRETPAAEGSQQGNQVACTDPSQLRAEPALFFGPSTPRSEPIQQLFEFLKTLDPMDKNGAMSGDCDIETSQMEDFLAETFGFRNIDGEEIVHGVKSFELRKPLNSKKPETLITFPSKKNPLFEMTVAEIEKWQQTYVVYADINEQNLNEQFLLKALRGLSKYGEEAFHMKFVVRISKCPILMEFDGRTIPRKVEEKWPHLIRLVSVTGVDFAGRIHDVDDIRTYLSNWEEVYEVDRRSGYPVVYGGRDFRRIRHGPLGQLKERLLLDDLIRMARLRLRACDEEKVQIVVETGIGLGVFAGRAIGIDHKVRALSAIAIRNVLQKDGPNYKNILGIVFALPVFDQDRQDDRRQDTYQAFADEFNKSQYQGPIPVMVADQDMHRLTVAIAKRGFRVSELNPADSHGVFGEYWQNRGPAVEEKLALTTLGLLVQHHLINPFVLDQSHYRFIPSRT